VRRAAVMSLQRVWRGHRGRVGVKLAMRTHVAVVRRRFRAATVIQTNVRRALATRRVNELRERHLQSLMTLAREWIEAWNEEHQAYSYQKHQLEDTEQTLLWEPPSTGYKKVDGRLVLQNGKVIEDPLSSQDDEKQIQLCIDCETTPATRQCHQCNDAYCTKCYLSAHPLGGKREHHTFDRIGPILCDDCGTAQADKWCLSCDDPFCEPCYNKIHATGNRTHHRYRKVYGEMVSPRVWEGDGTGPVSIYEMEGGHTGEEVQGDAPPGYESWDGSGEQQPGDWTLEYDEEGRSYYHNSVTGEAHYHDQGVVEEVTSGALVEGTMMPEQGQYQQEMMADWNHGDGGAYYEQQHQQQ